jgi:hypothetical protein
MSDYFRIPVPENLVSAFPWKCLLSRELLIKGCIDWYILQLTIEFLTGRTFKNERDYDGIAQHFGAKDSETFTADNVPKFFKSNLIFQTSIINEFVRLLSDENMKESWINETKKVIGIGAHFIQISVLNEKLYVPQSRFTIEEFCDFVIIELFSDNLYFYKSDMDDKIDEVIVKEQMLTYLNSVITFV